MVFWRRASVDGTTGQQRQALAFSCQLDLARQGEAEALSLLYRQFLPGVFAYIAARVPDRTTAEDLTSEVFMRMIESIHHVRASDEVGFAAWLFQIARVTVAGYYRRQERQPITLPLEPLPAQEESQALNVAVVATHPDSDPVWQAEVREEWHAVARAINQLTDEQRQVIISRLILGYDVETVARMIGKKPNAVKALQFRALQSIHRYLKKEGMSNLSGSGFASGVPGREECHESPL
jgi:RNA polymerase sigma-70 factor (ECF subfamily)